MSRLLTTAKRQKTMGRAALWWARRLRVG
jgi:hypothetical protein